MGKVTVSVPAAIPDLGVGQHSLSLAVGMFMTIQMSESSPGLMVHLDSEGFMSMSSSAAHPVIQGARIVFRTKQLAPDGLQVSVHNEIPLDIGLPVEDVALLAGIVAGNVVIGSPLNRAQILELALEYAQQPFLMATLYDGGLRAFQNVAR